MLVIVITNLVDRDDTRVIEISGRFSFGLESLDFFLAGEFARQNHFQSHDPVQLDLPSFEYHAHAAAGNLFQQFVITEVLNAVTTRDSIVVLTWYECRFVGQGIWRGPGDRLVTIRHLRIIFFRNGPLTERLKGLIDC